MSSTRAYILHSIVTFKCVCLISNLLDINTANTIFREKINALGRCGQVGLCCDQRSS